MEIKDRAKYFDTIKITIFVKDNDEWIEEQPAREGEQANE